LFRPRSSWRSGFVISLQQVREEEDDDFDLASSCARLVRNSVELSSETPSAEDVRHLAAVAEGMIAAAGNFNQSLVN
jgi:hypothetical protein